MLRTWIKESTKNFNQSIKNEEDLKIKIIIPYLKELGYEIDEIKFEMAIPVQTGTKEITVKSDIGIEINGNIELIIDTKTPKKVLSEKDIIQSTSYAKLVSTPPCPYAVTTNGLECVMTNVYTGERKTEIIKKDELVREVQKLRRRKLTDIEIKELKSVLFTITNQEELYKIIKKCKDIIEQKSHIRSDQSFKEMTKILLVKMNEEKRTHNNENNRFSLEYLKRASKAGEDAQELDVFKDLFEDAKKSYPSIYNNQYVQLNLNSNSNLIEIVKLLEPWSFLGTGDDIKGSVYEIFLKSTLRGEFDQYFTPREIVDFMVNMAKPKIGEKILDPACGSGGFLIQVFNYVNDLIRKQQHLSEVDKRETFYHLINDCLWGQEVDEDLHVLAKINLIMHGDGHNNIYQGDTLSSNTLKDGYFDLILANPPFTIPLNDEKILSNYDLGLGKISEEKDILFFEKSISLLSSDKAGELFIILPEGLLNLDKYEYFRKWVLEKCHVTMIISLPEGAFIPFGKSVSKTAILGVRKKNDNTQHIPERVFVGNAKEIGFECSKKNYNPKIENDLLEFQQFNLKIFNGIKYTTNGSECALVECEKIDSSRFDAPYLLNSIDIEGIKKNFDNIYKMGDVCRIENKPFKPVKDQFYNYVEITDIMPNIGTLTNVKNLRGSEIGSGKKYFNSGDLIYSRINPRKNRVCVIPENIDMGVISNEAYNITIQNDLIISNYVLCAILQSSFVKNQLVRLATGSSSSRARVPESDMLDFVFIPIPSQYQQKLIHEKYSKAYKQYWQKSQKLFDAFLNIQNSLDSDYNQNNLF